MTKFAHLFSLTIACAILCGLLFFGCKKAPQSYKFTLERSEWRCCDGIWHEVSSSKFYIVKLGTDQTGMAHVNSFEAMIGGRICTTEFRTRVLNYQHND